LNGIKEKGKTPLNGAFYDGTAADIFRAQLRNFFLRFCPVSLTITTSVASRDDVS
jgi:hypothetical protein